MKLLTSICVLLLFLFALPYSRFCSAAQDHATSAMKPVRRFTDWPS